MKPSSSTQTYFKTITMSFPNTNTNKSLPQNFNTQSKKNNLKENFLFSKGWWAKEVMV